MIKRLAHLALPYGLNLIYAVFLLVASPWLLARFISGKNRRGWGQKLLGLPPGELPSEKPSPAGIPGESECVWIHAVSVGEVNLLDPFIDALLSARPGLRLAISTTTETGFDLARRRYPQHEVFFCPFDFSWAIRRVLDRLSPAALVLTELELWPNLISVCRLAGVPVLVINGRLSESSFRGYRRFGWLTARGIQGLAGVAVQSQRYAERFVQLGCDAERVVVTGNIKFDRRVERDGDRAAQLCRTAGIEDSDFVLVAGSTQLEEDLMMVELFQQLSQSHPQFKVVLAPRHPARCPALGRQLKSMEVPFQFRSALKTGDAPRVLVVDGIGELGAWWVRANVAYVGGSMGKREGQNMIEPAALGVPVCFGPRTRNFRDVVDQLLAQDAAVVIRDVDSLASFVIGTMTKPDWARQMGRRAQGVVTANCGASGRTVAYLEQLVWQAPPPQRI